MFDSFTLDIRLSLGTTDRTDARNKGAALTAATLQVMKMLNDRAKAADARPTEEELQGIARKAYGERLAQFCDDQRSYPHHASEHSVANRTWADYYDRLNRNGGHIAMIPDEDRAWRIMGWDAQRVDNLRLAINHVQDGNPPISRRFVDHHLTELGYQPHNGLRQMVERALYPAYRDACLEAERTLQGQGAFAGPPVTASNDPARGPAHTVTPAPRSEAPEPIPEYITDFVEQAIDDRVADGEWDIKSGRQARSTVALFEMLIGRKSFADYTQSDFASFMRKIRFVPERYDMTSATSRDSVLKAVAEGEASDSLGKTARSRSGERSNRTRNRHLSSLHAVCRWAEKNGKLAPNIKFELLFTVAANKKRSRHERQATSNNDVAALFALPVFIGCEPHSGGTGQRVLKARFTPGDTIVHDAFYWVPLLLYYTGARREEVCKLSPHDVLEGLVPSIKIDFTEFGRLKNDHSVRLVPLHSELVRLGFLDFARECRDREYDVLFPELRSTNNVQKFGDVYFKNVWHNLKTRAGLTGEATNHGMRHRFATALKNKKVFSEFRRDVMGHAGHNINEERYSDVGPLLELKAIVDELPSVTSALPSAVPNLPPMACRNAQPRKRRTKSSGAD